MAKRRLDIVATYKTDGANTKLRQTSKGVTNVGVAAEGADQKTKSFGDSLKAASESAGGAVKKFGEVFKVSEELTSTMGKGLGVIGLAVVAWKALGGIWDWATDSAKKAADKTAALNFQLEEQKRIADEATASLAALGATRLALAFASPDQIQRTSDLSVAMKGAKAEILAQAQNLDRNAEALKANAFALRAVRAEQRQAFAALPPGARALQRLGEAEDVDLAEMRKERAKLEQEGAALDATREAIGQRIGASQQRLLAAKSSLETIQESLKQAIEASLATVPIEGAGPKEGKRAERQPRGNDPDARPTFDPSKDVAGPGQVGTDRQTPADGILSGISPLILGLRAASKAQEEWNRQTELGTQAALSFAAASTQAALAAVVNAALRGESGIAALNAALQHVTSEAIVLGLMETGKGIAAAAIGSPMAAKHFAAAKVFGITAAVAGAGTLATGGFGSGGGGGGGAGTGTPGRSTLPRDREQDRDQNITLMMDLGSRGWASKRDFERTSARAVRNEGRRPGGVRISARG